MIPLGTYHSYTEYKQHRRNPYFSNGIANKTNYEAALFMIAA